MSQHSISVFFISMGSLLLPNHQNLPVWFRVYSIQSAWRNKKNKSINIYIYIFTETCESRFLQTSSFDNLFGVSMKPRALTWKSSSTWHNCLNKSTTNQIFFNLSFWGSAFYSLVHNRTHKTTKEKKTNNSTT